MFLVCMVCCCKGLSDLGNGINFIYEFYMLNMYTNTSDNIPVVSNDNFDFQILSVNRLIC